MGSTGVRRLGGVSKPTRRAGGHAAPALHCPAPENPSHGHAATRDGDADGNHPSASAIAPSSPVGPLSVDGLVEDAALRRAGLLTREEVLRRRLWRVRQLERYYRRQYWALLEAVRVRHRDYYWSFGRSPVEGEGAGGGGGGGEGEEKTAGVAAGFAAVEGCGESGRAGGGFGGGDVAGSSSRKRDKDRCALPGCRTKAMALTRYCHLHILADQKQHLYKACAYPIKSMHTGPVACGKPVLRAQPLTYCPTHIQKAQKNVSQALRKTGLSQNSSRALPRIHVIVAECVRQIQAKRTEVLEAVVKRTVDEG